MIINDAHLVKHLFLHSDEEKVVATQGCRAGAILRQAQL